MLVKCSHSSIRKKETIVSYCEIVFAFFFLPRLSEHFVLLNMQSIQIDRPSGIALKSMQNLDVELSQSIHLMWLNNKTRGLGSIHCERQDSFAPVQTV